MVRGEGREGPHDGLDEHGRTAVLVTTLLVAFLAFTGVAATVPGGFAQPGADGAGGGALPEGDLLALAIADGVIAFLLGYRASALRVLNARDALISALTYAAAIAIGAAAVRAMAIPRFLGPALGSLHMFFHRLGPVLARRLLLTGDIIEAGAVEHLGVFTETCDAGSVTARARYWAEKAAKMPADGVVIANVMLLTLLERTGEIAVRRTEGATRGDIAAQFLAEAGVLGVAGSALGIPLGFFLAWVRLQFAPYTLMTAAFPPKTVAVACAVGIGTALLAGVLPARRAALLDPAAALREP